MRRTRRPTPAERRGLRERRNAERTVERERYATLRDARINLHAALCRYFDIGALRPFALPIVNRRVG